jgi:hypothetical protein
MISRTSSALIESFDAVLALGSSKHLVAVAMFGIGVFAPSSTNNVKAEEAEEAEACEAKRFTELISTFLAVDALIRGYQLLGVLLPMRGCERKVVRFWLGLRRYPSPRILFAVWV